MKVGLRIFSTCLSPFFSIQMIVGSRPKLEQCVWVVRNMRHMRILIMYTVYTYRYIFFWGMKGEHSLFSSGWPLIRVHLNRDWHYSSLYVSPRFVHCKTCSTVTTVILWARQSHDIVYLWTCLLKKHCCKYFCLMNSVYDYCYHNITK